MAYWDAIYECIRKVDNENLRIYVNTYFQDSEKESEILVFDDNKSSELFAMLLKDKLQDLPEVKKAIEDTIYDVSQREDWWLDLATDNSWTYMDEGFVCDECELWHFYDDYGATSYANYKVYDGYILCENCIRRTIESKEEYIKDMIDNPNNANTILTNKDFIELDFSKYNFDTYANGWYHRKDNPEAILDKAKADYPHHEFVFSIVKTYNPFETQFDLYMRKAG